MKAQITLRLEADSVARVDAARLPQKPGEPIPNRTAVIRQAIDIGLDALELQRKGGAKSVPSTPEQPTP